VVFSTKNRTNLVQPEIEDELYSYICGIVKGQKGEVLEIGGTLNHVHILARLHPSISLSDMMRYIKGGSSKWIHEKGVSLFQWQRGYGVFSVSESVLEQVAEYIRNQKQHHMKYSFEKEYLLLLEKHKIKYDENYIWE